MKTKIAKYCLSIAALSAFTAISVVNFTAYAALQKVGVR